MTTMRQRENFGWQEGKRIAAAALLGFSLGLATATAQAQDLPPVDRFWCWTCGSYPEFRLGDYSRLEAPIINPASGSQFLNNVIPPDRLLAHGAWPEDLYNRNRSVFSGTAGRVAQHVAEGWTPLHEAVYRGSSSHPQRRLNPAHLDRVLDDWPDALNSGLRNPAWQAGRTPLHLAALWASFRPGMVERLLDRGADIHARDSRGNTPLLWARSREAFEALRAAGADIRAQSDSGYTVLHRAASLGDAALVQELLDAEFNPNAPLSNGWTPLLSANSREAFEALRAAGADIRAQSDSGYTVLHRAAFLGDAALVRELLDADPDLDPNAPTSSGWTPLLFARSQEAFEALRAHGANVAVIEEAFSPEKLLEATQTSPSGRAQLRLLNRAVEQVGRFLDEAWLPRLRAVNPDFHAVPVNYGRSSVWRFPLQYAAQYNEDPAAIAALIGDSFGHFTYRDTIYRYNVTPNGATQLAAGDFGVGRPLNRGSERPLYLAARYNGNPAVVEALLAAGADANADNGLALIGAAGNQTPRAAEIVQALLAAGASVDGVEPSDGEKALRPVYAAAMVQNMATLDALLAAGADVNVVGSTSYYSLLADVLSRGRFDCGYGPIADRLRSAGARAVRFTESGEVPFTPGPQVAECDPVSAEMAEIRELIDSGADLGATALHFAIWRRAGLATVQALLSAGADPNAQDMRGGTPLHWAARIRRVDPAVVELLLWAGADVHAKDNINQTALDYATHADIGNETVAALLRAAGGT